MILDTSAIFAILTAEPEAERMIDALESDPTRLMSAATFVELGIVVEARFGDAGSRELDLLLHRLDAKTVAVTAEQAERARLAWRRFGRGRHAARLNFGDTFPYALSVISGEPLLFKGVDFARTDVSAVDY